MKDYMVVHGGKAHQDDFLACCLILAKHQITTIVRRPPTPEELDDPLIFVVDVGGRHEIERSNFDHHQFTDGRIECAFSLVLQAFSMYEDAKLIWPWLPVLELQDCRGRNAVAEHYGIQGGADTVTALTSPIATSMLRMFGDCDRVSAEDPLLDFMHHIGSGLVEGLEATRNRLVRLHSHITVSEVNGVKVLTVDPLLDNPMMAMELWRRRNAPDAAVVVTKNEREPGLVFKRFDDHPDVDFKRIKGLPGVNFVHATGFVASVNLPSQKAVDIALNLSIMPSSNDAKRLVEWIELLKEARAAAAIYERNKDVVKVTAAS